MTPQPARIAHYTIAGKLGEGGMGAVYRATDTKLNRDVAIKVLPPAFKEDEGRMARFEREAQVLASLNHPNIAAIYGIEQGAIVMELVEGEDLKGPVPMDAAIAYARQIAAGLEAAHERGIIHRDLKPANIKVTPDGVVKLLDFGLAKATEQSAASATGASPTMSPTMSLAMTQAGMILGTAAYMSPEQAKGKPVDKRADIWAFGVILFELLTGRPLFGGGETVTETLAAVVLKEPDVAALPRDTPPRVRSLIERCLRKDPKLRLRDIGEARLTLDEAEPPAAARAPLVAQPSRALRWALAAVSVAALAGTVLAVSHFRESSPEAAPVRFTFAPGEAQLAVGSRIQLSPDGRTVAYNAKGRDGAFRLWVRPLDALESRALAGTEGASCLFWSPDSRWLAFSADGRLKKVEVSGGAPQSLCNAPSPLTAGAWNASGDLIFSAMGSGTGLFRVSQAGGPVTSATQLDRGRRETSHGFPLFLPDGRRFLYLSASTVAENFGIYAGSLDNKDVRLVLSGIRGQAAYAPPGAPDATGHILFPREGTIFAQAFDADRLTVSGDPVPAAAQVWSYRTYAFFSASAGALAYRSGSSRFLPHLTWFDRQGKSLGDLGEPGLHGAIALSRDGRMVASQTTDRSGNLDIWQTQIARGVTTRFTFDPAADSSPVWSPDGNRLVFASRRDRVEDLYVKETAGTRNEELLLKSDLPKRPYDWSPDGQFLIYGVIAPDTRSDLWVLPLSGDRKPRPFLQTPYNEMQAQFSPGPSGKTRWVAYVSDESGVLQVYAQSFEASGGTGAKFQISNAGGGVQPRWRADGKELYYIANGSTDVMAVEVKTSPAFEVGVPRKLFSVYLTGGVMLNYLFDVMPDGRAS